MPDQLLPKAVQDKAAPVPDAVPQQRTWVRGDRPVAEQSMVIMGERRSPDQLRAELKDAKARLDRPSNELPEGQTLEDLVGAAALAQEPDVWDAMFKAFTRKVNTELEQSKKDANKAARGAATASALDRAGSLQEWQGMAGPAAEVADEKASTALKRQAAQEVHAMAQDILFHKDNIEKTTKRAAKELRRELQALAVREGVEKYLRATRFTAESVGEHTDKVIELTGEKLPRSYINRVWPAMVNLETGIRTAHVDLDAGDSRAALRVLTDEDVFQVTRLKVAREVAHQVAADVSEQLLADTVAAAKKKADEPGSFYKTRRNSIQAEANQRTASLLGGRGLSTEDQALVDKAEADVSLTLKRGAMASRAADVMERIDALVPHSGDAASLDVGFEVTAQNWYLGVKVSGQVERDTDTDETMPGSTVDVTKAKLSVELTGGGTGGALRAGAKVGLFIEGTSKRGGAGIADMISYAIYRQFEESRTPPREVIGRLWGFGGVNEPEMKKDKARYVEAHKWAKFIEGMMSKKDEAFLGMEAGLETEVGFEDADAGGSASVSVASGRVYDKEGIAARLEQPGPKRNRRDMDYAAKGGALPVRGKKSTLGYRRTKLATSLSGSIGPFAGDIGSEWAWHEEDLTGFATKGSFDITVPTVGGEALFLHRVNDLVARLTPEMQKSLARSASAASKKTDKTTKKNFGTDSQEVQGKAGARLKAAPDLSGHVIAGLRKHGGATAAATAGGLLATLTPGVTASTALSLSGAVAMTREWSPRIGPDGKHEKGDWSDPRITLELRRGSTLGASIPGAVAVSMSKSSRLVRLQLSTGSVSVD